MKNVDLFLRYAESMHKMALDKKLQQSQSLTLHKELSLDKQAFSYLDDSLLWSVRNTSNNNSQNRTAEP